MKKRKTQQIVFSSTASTPTQAQMKISKIRNSSFLNRGEGGEGDKRGKVFERTRKEKKNFFWWFCGEKKLFPPIKQKA